MKHQVFAVAVGSSGSSDLDSFPSSQPTGTVFAREAEKSGTLSLPPKASTRGMVILPGGSGEYLESFSRTEVDLFA